MFTFVAVMGLTFVVVIVVGLVLAPWVKQPKELQTPEQVVVSEGWMSERRWDL